MTVADYEPVIGLEVHCQLATATKMFSPCPVTIGAPPNTQVDAYTLGLPGTLPVPNAEAVRCAVAMALATRSEIQSHSRFARKHYFYPDLPKGYQITQSDHPYALGGTIDVPEPDGGTTTVRLVRIHMEEDAGKNTHVAGEDVSLLDYNRAGAPLLEIVSEPDLRSSGQAAAYLRELRTMIRYLGISEANMEEGTLRCDANVSLRPRGTEALGTRCEIKNLNSFRFLEQAIEAEIRRQADILDHGGAVRQATLSFDPQKGQTREERIKEEAADYRYFPEPDVPPLHIPAALVAEVENSMPAMPATRRRRYAEAGLGADDARLIASDPDLAAYFDETLAAGAPAKRASNWITVELLGRLNADGARIASSPIRPPDLAELVGLVEDGTVSGRAAKEIFGKVYAGQGSPKQIVERDGYRQVSDTAVLEQAVREVIDASPKQVEQYRQGKTNLKGYFVGQVMKRTRGQANPKLVAELVETLLTEPV